MNLMPEAIHHSWLLYFNRVVALYVLYVSSLMVHSRNRNKTLFDAYLDLWYRKSWINMVLNKI